MSEFGSWISHCGNGCPCKGQFVESLSADGTVRQHIAHGIKGDVDAWDWAHCCAHGRPQWRVIRYRIRKPRGLAILEDMLVDVPEVVA